MRLLSLRSLPPFLIAIIPSISAAAGVDRLPGQILSDKPSPRWWAPIVPPMPTNKMGPFIRLPDRSVFTVDEAFGYCSDDEGRSWRRGVPLFSPDAPALVSDERVLLLTKANTI